MKTIPQPTIERLLIYYRFLEKIAKFNEIRYITSLKMGGKLGISPVIIRKDLSFCQKVGCKGVGYEVYGLKKSIGKGQIIHVFNWNGELIKKLKLNKKIKYISINKSNIITALGFDKNNKLKLLKYEFSL